jgi:succinate dehydrogenase/fumarate reductase cytochrome b subunit
MQPPDALPPSWQRLLALSGVVFGVLFLVGWFASGGDAPDYAAADADWTEWADDNQWRSRIGAFAMLLAGFVLLHFAATIRTALGDAERRAGGSAQLARVAFAGAITGMAGMAMAIVIISSATTEGADANPIVTRAVATASAGPFLLSAMGFAAFLAAGGLVTLRSGVFARWTGVVALIGAVSFLVAFAAILSGLGEDSVFGFGFFPGVLALVIWSIATSIARYRAVATTAGEFVATETNA